MRPRWQAIDAEVGVALWRALRPLLDIVPSIHVGATCTTDDYVLTEVWAGDAPLLRCESRYVGADRDEDGVLRRGAGEHAYAVPVPLDDEAGDEAATEREAQLGARVDELEQHVGSLHKATARGMAHERALVVAFLRSGAERASSPYPVILDALRQAVLAGASAIERGEHHEGPAAGEEE